VAKYRILIKPSAVKELKKIPKKDIAKITDKIQALADNPQPEGCEELAEKNAYRIRQGSYRIIYTIEDDILIVIVLKIAHRRDVYR
jgi:mRNA interferase RelE/StbE